MLSNVQYVAEKKPDNFFISCTTENPAWSFPLWRKTVICIQEIELDVYMPYSQWLMTGSKV